MLKSLIKVLSILPFLVSCSSFELPIIANLETEQDMEPLYINHEMASVMVDDYPLELFTDYGYPNSCLLAENKPSIIEPVWHPVETVWQRIRVGFKWDNTVDNKRIGAEFNWYKRNPAYMARVSHRAERYLYYVVEQLDKHNLPLELALLPIVESAFDPFAYSHGRASGMWQFIPATGRRFNMRQDWWYDGRRDIIASTQGAIGYLKSLNKAYDGDWLLALAAYNSGQGRVNKAIRKNRKRGKGTDFWSLDLPRETRSYVPKLLALAKLVDNPRRYGIELKPIKNVPYFAEVDIGSQLDLAQAAKLADIELEEIYRLNPGFNRWATSPKGPHRLLVPIEKQATFEQNISALPSEKRLNWQRHTIKRGDSLIKLAKKFNTDVSTIKQVNGLKGNLLRAGKSLLIPTATLDSSAYSLSTEQRISSIQKNRTGAKGSSQVFHTVKSGESFWTIAKKYRVSVSSLARWNGMAPRDTLKIGKKLSVWTKTNISAENSNLQPGQREAMVKKVAYRVRNGDSLARIADKFNIRIKDITRWNAINPKKYLQPGQQLTLYINIMNSVN